MKFVRLLIIYLFIVTKILIAETDEYELKSISFSGNKHFSSRILSSVIVSKESPFWFWKFLNKFTNLGKEPVYFDSTNIIADINKLKNFYKDNGFFQVNILSEYKLNYRNKSAKLFFIIEEGERFRINEYNYIGIDSGKIGSWLYSKILKQQPIRKDHYFQKDRIEADADRIVTELRNFGFMLAEKGKISATVDTVKKTVNVVLEFNPNRYFTISEVRVEKTGYAKDNVSDNLILDIVRIKPGEKYNHFQLSQGQLRLYRTELFTSALVNGVISDTNNNTVPINISVDVGKINELGPELIVNNQSNRFNIGLGANYTRKNFLGAARKLSINGSIITQDIFNIDFKNVFGKNGLKDTTLFGEASINFSIEQPYLWQKDIRGRLDFYASVEQQKFYRYFTNGSRISFLFELPKFVFFNNYNAYLGIESEDLNMKAGLPIEYMKAILISAGFPITPEDTTQAILESMSESYFKNSNAVIGLDMFANHANEMFYPTSGFNLQLFFEYTGLLPFLKNLILTEKDRSIQYYKTSVGISFYTNPFKPVRGAVAYKLKVGYLQKVEGEKSVSQSKYFFAGGSNSIRGWRARGLGPIVTYVSETGKTITISEIGGKCLLEGSIEVRNILFGDFGSAVFFDFGNTWRNLKDVSIKTTALTFGFGLRYYTSFAPLRLDIGTQFYDPYSNRFINKRKLLDAIQLHIGIGEAF